MDKLKLGNAEYDLSPAVEDPVYANVLRFNQKVLGRFSRVIYFWDCKTQTGLPARRPRATTHQPHGYFYVFNLMNGRAQRGPSTTNAQVHVAKTGLNGPALVAALRAKLPPVVAPVPYATLLDPFKRDYMVAIVVNVALMTFTGKRVRAAGEAAEPGEDVIWITYPRAITYTARLIARCDGKPVVKPEHWQDTLDVPLEWTGLRKQMKEAHDQALQAHDKPDHPH